MRTKLFKVFAQRSGWCRPATLLLVTLAGCFAAEEAAAGRCRMSLEQQSIDQAGQVSITVFSPSRYCVDPARQTDMSAYNGEVRITNTGTVPVKVTYTSGNAGFRAFSSVALSQPQGRKSAIHFSSPPLAPSEIKFSSVSLSQGQMLTLKSWSRHQSAIEHMMLTDRHRNARGFLVDYSYSFEIDGRIFSGTSRTKMTAILGEGK